MRDSCHKHKINKRKSFVKQSERKSKTNNPKINAALDTDEKLVGCSGKRRYPDLITAHAGAHHMTTITGSSEVYLYPCDHCGGYHLTKAPVSPNGEINRWVYNFGKD